MRQAPRLRVRHRRLFVLTGAGCTTRSGIPDDRDADAKWKRAQPVRKEPAGAIGRAALSASGAFVGPPDDAHRALSRLETMGRIELVVTQNYATDTFSQRPRSRGSRPFMWSILKGSKGSN
jgi:NAD-dependent SIR2 family protein deacetylase